MKYIIAAGIMLLATDSAAANSICLTKAEARQLWPKQHIYWYSADHCWSNRRGGPPTGIKKERIDKIPIRAEAPRNYIYPLDSNGNLDHEFEDYCCWPDISDIKAHMKVVK